MHAINLEKILWTILAAGFISLAVVHLVLG